MTDQNHVEPVVEIQTEPKPGSPGVMRRIFRILFRLLVSVVIGLALGAGLYFGAVRLYRETIVPIQNYEDRIADLERTSERLGQIVESSSRELQDRQAALEGRLAEQAEDIASVEALVEASQQDLREQRRILGELPELEAGLAQVALELGDLTILVGELEAAIASGDLPAQQVQRTATYLRAMSMLTRAQLELERVNLGFAAEQVEAARATVRELVDDEGADSYGDEALIGTILQRLDVILSELPGRPDVAANDLEAVWRLFTQALQPVQLEEPDSGGE